MNEVGIELGGASVGSESLRQVLHRWNHCLGMADWYVHIERDLRRYILGRPSTMRERRIRWAIYDLVAGALESCTIALGSPALGADSARKAVTRLVVHHTGTDPYISLSRLSAMGLLRLYAPSYLKHQKAPHRHGQPITSNHVRDGRQVFYSYHWLIRPGGRAERLLSDEEIGWHAGNWDVNCSSIGVALAGDYGNCSPTKQALSCLHSLIEEYAPEEVLLHSEINSATTCPGEWAAAVAWSQLGKNYLSRV